MWQHSHIKYEMPKQSCTAMLILFKATYIFRYEDIYNTSVYYNFDTHNYVQFTNTKMESIEILESTFLCGACIMFGVISQDAKISECCFKRCVKSASIFSSVSASTNLSFFHTKTYYTKIL